MIFKVEYRKLRDGRLNAVQKSSILLQFIISSKEEWKDLKEAIVNADTDKIYNSCRYIKEISAYFNFEEVLAIKMNIDDKAKQKVFDVNLYYEMINEWSRQICGLRTTTYKKYNHMNLAG